MEFLILTLPKQFNTKIIGQPNHPSRRRNDYPALHRRCGGRAREFEHALGGSPAGERHGCGAPLRADLPDYWERNRDGKGQHHAKGRFFLQNDV